MFGASFGSSIWPLVARASSSSRAAVALSMAVRCGGAGRAVLVAAGNRAGHLT